MGLPPGNWNIGVQPAAPKPPPATFDVIWGVIGKFIKGWAPTVFWTIVSLILLTFAYNLGASQGNYWAAFNTTVTEVKSWLPRFTPNPAGTLPPALNRVPGQNGYAVLVSTAPSQVIATQIINSLRSSRTPAKMYPFFNTYVVYVDGFPTLNSARSARNKIAQRGYPASRVVAP